MKTLANILNSKIERDELTFVTSGLLKLEAENKMLKEICAELQKSNEFYADKNNWDERWFENMGGDSSGDINDQIVFIDVDTENDDDGKPYYTFGGRIARQAQNQINKIINGAKSE